MIIADCASFEMTKIFFLIYRSFADGFSPVVPRPISPVESDDEEMFDGFGVVTKSTMKKIDNTTDTSQSIDCEIIMNIIPHINLCHPNR
jgi:hypothetical protein